MISDMIIIILMVIVFTCWSFLSFFVGLLAAIIFPFGHLTPYAYGKKDAWLLPRARPDKGVEIW